MVLILLLALTLIGLRSEPGSKTVASHDQATHGSGAARHG